MKKTVMAAVVGLLVSVSSANAALLDFTDEVYLNDPLSFAGSGSSYTGTIDGIGYTLTATGGDLRFDEGVAGSACAAGPLECDVDGLGIGDDEIRGLTINSGQMLTIIFDVPVIVEAFYFLDLFDKRGSGKGREQAAVSFDGGAHEKYDAALSGNGGYLESLLTPGIVGQSLVFTAFDSIELRDDATNDYALAGISLTAVPVPAAGMLLLGAIGAFGALAIQRKS